LGLARLFRQSLKDRPALDAPIPCSLILAKKVPAL
jgi:hypothetical protein